MTDNLTLVTPPSLFLPSSGARILLIGEGHAWKNNIIKLLKGETQSPGVDFTDVSVPPTIYYCDDNEDYNWIYYQLPHVDQIIYFFNQNTSLLGAALFGMLVSDNRLHVIHDGSTSSQNVLFLYADKSKRQPTTDATNALITVYDACR